MVNIPLNVAAQNSSLLKDKSNWTGGQTSMPAVPWGDQAEIGLSAFGVAAPGCSDAPPLTGARPRVHNCNIHHWRGAGIRNTQFDGVIESVDSHDNYIGAVLTSSDYQICNSQLYNNRDACLWVAGGDFANCRSTNNHYYGARIACYNSGSRFFRSVNDVFADGYIGFYGGINGAGANSCTITNALSQHLLVRDYILRASRMSLVNCVTAIGKAVNQCNGVTISDDGFNVLTRSIIGAGNAKVGIEMGDKCSINGGHVLLDTFVHDLHTASGAPCEAIWVPHDSHSVLIDTYLEDGQGINGAVGIRFKGAHRNPVVDVRTDGWHGSNSRVVIFDNGAACEGLDVTIRVDGVVSKNIADYVDIGTGWTGAIRMINGTTGLTTSIAEGQAA